MPVAYTLKLETLLALLARNVPSPPPKVIFRQPQPLSAVELAFRPLLHQLVHKSNLKSHMYHRSTLPEPVLEAGTVTAQAVLKDVMVVLPSTIGLRSPRLVENPEPRPRQGALKPRHKMAMPKIRLALGLPMH